MSFWRRLLGFDPASKDGGVVSLRASDFYGGRLIVEPTEYEYRGLDQELIAWQPKAVSRHGVISISDYKPKGKPLADKESKRVQGLHLDDYQPRATEHPAFRLQWERSFPTPPPMTMEEVDRRYGGFFGRDEPRAWVHYRNRHPGIRDFALGALPPMRDAMADLLLFLAEINEDLQRRDLVAVEVSVSHEPAEQIGREAEPCAERQGWHYRVDALVVPSAVLAEEQQHFETLQAQRAERAAEVEQRAKR